MSTELSAAALHVEGYHDLRGGPQDRGWVVGAWFTPDYAHWTVPFRQSLEEVGASYHILACDRVGSGWESETMQKPRVVRRLMSENPGKTVVLLDVDCQVRKCPSQLVDNVSGDVAAYIRAKRTGRGKDRARIKVMSGTMVFRPTAGARRFVEAWEAAGAECDAFDVDQTSLMIALGRATNFTFQPLPSEWCDFEGLNAQPAIVHDHASEDSPRASWLQRSMARLARSTLPPALSSRIAGRLRVEGGSEGSVGMAPRKPAGLAAE